MKKRRTEEETDRDVMAKCSDKSEACAASPEGPMGYFANMMDHCYDYAVAAKAAGRPVVGRWPPDGAESAE